MEQGIVVQRSNLNARKTQSGRFNLRGVSS